MDVRKWRVRKVDGKWQAFAPGWVWRSDFTGRSHGHCVSALPYLMRIYENQHRLGRFRR
jgi:hypothetical protein